MAASYKSEPRSNVCLRQLEKCTARRENLLCVGGTVRAEDLNFSCLWVFYSLCEFISSK